jgi:hypothetical protein
VIPVEFKAFDGMTESAVVEPFQVIMNHPPEMTVNGEAEPVVQDNGRKIEMPFQVSDVDGDPVTLFYKFDDAGEWSEAPSSSSPNTVPGFIFADLDRTVDHQLSILAFDGYDESEPVSLGVRAWIRGLGPRLLIPGRPLLGYPPYPAGEYVEANWE